METFEDYSPANQAYKFVNVKASKEAMQAKQNKELQSKVQYDGDKDDAIDSEWEFHAAMRGVDTQAKAQYGEDSNQMQALGLKKKSEYKKGGRRKSSPESKA